MENKKNWKKGLALCFNLCWRGKWRFGGGASWKKSYINEKISLRIKNCERNMFSFALRPAAVLTPSSLLSFARPGNQRTIKTE